MFEEIRKENKVTILALALLVLISFGLSLSLLSWGLPYYLHPDEQFVVTNTMRMAENRLLPTNSIYPPLMFYTHLSLYGSYFLMLKATGEVSSLSDFADFYHSNQSNFFMISRGLTILASMLILILVFVFARKISNNSAAGLLASFFLVISPGFLASSTLIKADIFIALFLLLAMYWLIAKNRQNGKIAETEKKGKPHWIALFTALAFSLNYYGVFIVPIIVVGFLLLKQRDMVAPYLKKVVIFGVALNFLFLLNFTQGIKDILHVLSMVKDRTASLCIPFWEGNQFFGLWDGFGAPLLFAAAGLVYFWRQKRTDYRLLGVSSLLFLFFLFLISAREPRYSIAVYPLVAILAGAAIMKLYGYLAGKYKSNYFKAAFVLVLGLSLIPPIQATYGLVTNQDTRFVSADWIKENIPMDRVIATETYGPTLDSYFYYTWGYTGKDPYDGEGYYLIKDYYITDKNFYAADYIILSSLASDKTKYFCDKKPLETYGAIRSCPLIGSWRAEPANFWFHNPVINMYSNCLKPA
ncbi:MAG: phospholipid carrier-dependent glycosyltransferase [archaeon]